MSSGATTDWAASSRLSLRRRIELLERDLYPEVRINEYHDIPYAVFRYDPTDELVVRPEIQMLKTRLENKGKTVRTFSLAEFMKEALESGPTWNLDILCRAEADVGIEKTIQTIQAIVTDKCPLDRLVAERLNALDRANCIAFLTRAGALYPVYRVSALLDRLAEARVAVPVVLFYPGTLEGITGLRFMGALEAEHNYRARIY